MRAQRLSAMAVGTLAAMGAVPFTAISAQANTATNTRASAGNASVPTTEVAITGGPSLYFGSYGTTTEYTPQNGAQIGGNGSATGVTVAVQSASIDGGSRPFHISLDAGGPQPLAVGTTYTATGPGVGIPAITVDNCGTAATGTFRVDQMALDAQGNITHLQALAVFSCGGALPSSALLRINATVAPPAGAPSAAAPTAPSGSVSPMVFRRGTAIISNPGTGVDGGQIATVPSAAYGRVAWNPLGTRLFVSSGVGVVAVDPDGGRSRPVTEAVPVQQGSLLNARIAGDGRTLAVSPDGSTLVYNAVGPTGGLAAETTDGSQAGSPAQPLAKDFNCGGYADAPSFAPDGSLIVECGQNDVYRFANGTSTLLLKQAVHAVYSPDGRKIAFSRPDASGVAQIFTVNADGATGLTQVSQDPSGAREPAWSPDGKLLAYVNATSNEIVEIPVGGGAAVGSIPNADNPAWTPPLVDSHVIREWGSDRVATAVAASQLNFAAHGDTADWKRSQAGAVVLSRSDNFADALGGSALAVRKNAPLLITPTGGLDPAVAAEIHRVLAPGGTVYVLGGTSALSPAVAAGLAGYNVVRLSGPNRYATSVAIANTVDPATQDVLIATGDNYPDALAAGATGLPVILTAGAVMPKETAAYLDVATRRSTSFTPTYLFTIGGPADAALVSGYQAGLFAKDFPQLSRVKLAGATRYATALLVAQVFFGGESDAALATGAAWPDALSGGAMVGHRGGPLLLTDPAGVSPAVLSYLGQETNSLFALHLLGGPSALPNGIAQQGAGAFGLPGHVRIDGFTPGGVLPFAARPATTSAVRAAHTVTMSRAV